MAELAGHTVGSRPVSATVAGMTERPIAPFGPVVTAVMTPFTREGEVDYGTFSNLLRFLADHGSDSVLVAGTTGESPTLSTAEKVALFGAAIEACRGRMQVIAGTGTYDTKESIETSRTAAEIGCDGILAVTPYYSRPPQEGLYRHFSAIADATDLPMILYNIPGRTARVIEVETMARLAEHPRIVGVKDAVDDIEYTRKSLAAVTEDFAVYAGSDSMIRDIVHAGGVGVISVASHLVGRQVRRLVHAGTSGDTGDADRLHQVLMPLFTALFLEPNPMPLKAAMNAVWGPVGEPRLPLVPAGDDTVTAVETALESALAV